MYRCSEDAYITYLEKEIFCLVNTGFSINTLSERYTLEVPEVYRIYQETLQKTNVLNEQAITTLIEYEFICNDVNDFIKRIGISDLKEEYLIVLKTALHIAKDKPACMENMGKFFYPEVANTTGKPVSSVPPLLKKIYKCALENSNTSEATIFFRKALPKNRTDLRQIQVKKLLEVSVRCIK